MLSSTIFVALSALASFATAQELVGSGTPNFNNVSACCTIDGNRVDSNERLAWCRAQQNSCQSLCGGATNKNDCDSDKLTFNCICFSGNTPNISDYAQTLPSLQCEEWVKQCVTAHPNDLAGQTLCHSIACGAQNASAKAGPGPGSSTSGSAGPSSTGSATPSQSGSTTSSGGATSSSPAAGAAALTFARQYGTGALAAGFLIVFGMAL